MEKKPQTNQKDNEWNKKDVTDDEKTDENDTDDGKPHNYKYYELDF